MVLDFQTGRELTGENQESAAPEQNFPEVEAPQNEQDEEPQVIDIEPEPELDPEQQEGVPQFLPQIVEPQEEVPPPLPEDPGLHQGGTPPPLPEDPGQQQGGTPPPLPEDPGQQHGGTPPPLPEDPGQQQGGTPSALTEDSGHQQGGMSTYLSEDREHQEEIPPSPQRHSELGGGEIPQILLSDVEPKTESTTDTPQNTQESDANVDIHFTSNEMMAQGRTFATGGESTPTVVPMISPILQQIIEGAKIDLRYAATERGSIPTTGDDSMSSVVPMISPILQQIIEGAKVDLRLAATERDTTPSTEDDSSGFLPVPEIEILQPESLYPESESVHGTLLQEEFKEKVEYLFPSEKETEKFVEEIHLKDLKADMTGGFRTEQSDQTFDRPEGPLESDDNQARQPKKETKRRSITSRLDPADSHQSSEMTVELTRKVKRGKGGKRRQSTDRFDPGEPEHADPRELLKELQSYGELVSGSQEVGLHRPSLPDERSETRVATEYRLPGARKDEEAELPRPLGARMKDRGGETSRPHPSGARVGDQGGEVSRPHPLGTWVRDQGGEVSPHPLDARIRDQGGEVSPHPSGARIRDQGGEMSYPHLLDARNRAAECSRPLSPDVRIMDKGAENPRPLSPEVRIVDHEVEEHRPVSPEIPIEVLDVVEPRPPSPEEINDIGEEQPFLPQPPDDDPNHGGGIPNGFCPDGEQQSLEQEQRRQNKRTMSQCKALLSVVFLVVGCFTVLLIYAISAGFEGAANQTRRLVFNAANSSRPLMKLYTPIG